MTTMSKLKTRRAAVKKREIAADKQPQRSQRFKTADAKPNLAERVRRLENRLTNLGGES